MISAEAKRIVKVLKMYPNAHVHYFAPTMWSIYPSKEQFEEYWENGDGDKDLSEIEVLEGSDFDSTYLPPLTEALLYMEEKTGSSI